VKQVRSGKIEISKQIQTRLETVLQQEVMPATGCTEVGAVALASGWATRALGCDLATVGSVRIEVDAGTYKNALGVGIPGTGETGLEFAAAMGAVSAGGVQQGLQILGDPSPEAVEGARGLVRDGKVHIDKLPETRDITVRANVCSGADAASALIQGSHDHVVGVELNGKPYRGAPKEAEDHWHHAEQIKTLDFSTIVDFAREVDLSRVPVVEQALEMNTRFLKVALEKLPELKIGGAMQKYADLGTSGKDLAAKVQFIAALAVEARMGGLDRPVMACAGSGNQGLVATIPVAETAKALRARDELVLRALVLSYLTTIYVKTFTGLLSPICGCGVAAAVGAGCGMVFLLGGDTAQIEAQIRNMTGTMAGIICDGAKSGCAFKALMAIGLAVDSAYLSLENVSIPAGDGIAGRDVVDGLKNLQRITEEGMSGMDATVIQVMEGKGE
jgi:L-cysteine desulfidase